MALTVYPVTPDFVAEVGDVDLSRPLDSTDLAEIKQAFWTYAVLIFPDQHLSQDQHLEFAEHFGPLEVSISAYRAGDPQRMRVELANVSNLDADDELLPKDSRVLGMQRANLLWHTDSSFKQVPALTSLLYARAIPQVGGLTEFADARAAYDALPDDMKARLEGLVAEHWYLHSRAKSGFTTFTDVERENLPPVPQVMVRTGPESGRKALYVASHITRVLGLPEAEGEALVAELIAHTTQRQFVYPHRWRLHDLVMWDDRCTLHRGLGYDDLRWKRDMQRATVSDVGNTCEQAGIAVAAE
jgi:alpha-ketoglutarate-dependent 2,4-dichlorophenoxyacetate dioxygenase